MSQVNDWLSVATNIGIIIGLVFVGLEYRQNSHLVDIEARSNTNSQVNDLIDLVIQDETLVQLMGKNASDLSVAESDRLTLLGTRMLLAFEGIYRDTSERYGTEALAAPTQVWRSIYYRRLNYGMPHAWSTYKERIHSPFVQWFEANVVNRPPGA